MDLINWKKIFKVGGIAYCSIMLLMFLISLATINNKWYYDDVNYIALETFSNNTAFEQIEFQRNYKRDFKNNYKIPFDLKKSDLRREKMSIFDHLKELKVIALLFLLFIFIIVFIHCFGIIFGYWGELFVSKSQNR